MTIPPLHPRLTDEPISELENLLTPSVLRALRQCGAKTIGDAHAALASGRFGRVPGIGAVRERELADAIAFESELAARPSMADLVDRALEELEARPLRTFAQVAAREEALTLALRFYAEWGVYGPENDDLIREDGGDVARLALAILAKG